MDECVIVDEVMKPNSAVVVERWREREGSERKAGEGDYLWESRQPC
jgi:hypothetical protein